MWKKYYLKISSKIITIILCGLFIFLLVGCTKKRKTTKELIHNIMFDAPANFTHGEITGDDYDCKALALAIDCIAYDLNQNDFKVLKGCVELENDGKVVLGLIYTQYEEYAEEDGTKVYSCGFFQIKEKSQDTYFIKDDEVLDGLIATPLNDNDESLFVIDCCTTIEAYSGIYKNRYFKYSQVGDYVISLTVDENKQELYDENIDLYDFDNDRYVFRGKIEKKEIDVYNLFSDECMNLKNAIDAYNEIIEWQNNNEVTSDITTVALFDNDLVEDFIICQQQGKLNNYSISTIENIELEKRQYLQIGFDGISVKGRSDASDARLANGLIKVISGTVALVGTCVIAIYSGGAGLPLVVSAIGVITAGATAIYEVSNMIEGLQEVYYGAKNDTTSESINPVLKAFKSVIKDDQKATIAYHAWGISNGIISSLVFPVGKALEGMAKATKCIGMVEKSLRVTRAVVVHIAKVAITAAVASKVNECVQKKLDEVSDNIIANKLIAFGTTTVTAFVVYKGLDKLDKTFNVSGFEIKAKQEIPKREQEYLINNDTKTLSDNFEQNTWNTLSKETKQELLGEVADDIANKLKLPKKPEVVFDSNIKVSNGDYGVYCENDNTVYLSADFLKAKDKELIVESVKTIAHELKHAHQYQVMSDQTSIFYDEKMVYSLNHYITPETNFAAYQAQLCEADAVRYETLYANNFFGFAS